MKPRLALSAAVALALLLAFPAGQAGTAESPEITDPANDQEAGDAVPIMTQPPAGTTFGLNSDMLAGWVMESADALRLTIKVQGTGNPTVSSSNTWVFHLEVGGTGYDASATQQAASPAGSGAIEPGGVATGAEAPGGGLYHLIVPKSAIGNPAAGAILSNLFITNEAKQLGQVPRTVTDRAPDSGAGTNYVLTGGATGAADGAPAIVRANLTTEAIAVALGFSAPTNGTYLYNWTKGPASAAVALVINGTGSAAVLVKDAAGAPVLQANGTKALNATGAPGAWSIQVNLTAFQGNLTLAIAPRVAGTTSASSTAASGGGTVAAGGSASSGSGTESGSGKKGTPGLALPLAAAGLAFAAWRRSTGNSASRAKR